MYGAGEGDEFIPDLIDGKKLAQALAVLQFLIVRLKPDEPLSLFPPTGRAPVIILGAPRFEGFLKIADVPEGASPWVVLPALRSRHPFLRELHDATGREVQRLRHHFHFDRVRHRRRPR